MRRSKLNYWIDVVMGIAFVVSAVSGLVFLLPGGFLSIDQASTLGISFRLWDSLHLWGSLAMIAAVGGHLLLHTKWIVAMTKKLFGPRKPAIARRAAVPVQGSVLTPQATTLQRRRFLWLGGGVLGLGALAAGGAAFLGLRRVLGEDEAGILAEFAPAVSESAAVEAVGDGAAVKAGAVKADADEAPVEQLPLDERAPLDAMPEPTTTPVPTAESTTVPTPVPPVETAQELCVLCPHGLVNDPYPGRCRRYTDRDGDRICDLSVPQECG